VDICAERGSARGRGQRNKESETERERGLHPLHKNKRILANGTGWRRLIGCLKLQVIFRKRATNYTAILQKMTYDDKASYDVTPPCTISLTCNDLEQLLQEPNCTFARKSSNCILTRKIYTYIYICIYMCIYIHE